MEDTIVLYPSSGRTHLIPMVELGKLILTHHPSFSITIIIATQPSETVSTTASYIEAVSAATPSITFHHLPIISLPPNSSPPTEPRAILSFELPRVNNPNLHQALLNISNSSKPIKAFVIDFFCSPAFEVSASLNIPTYYFFTSSANGLAPFLYLPTIHKNTTKSLKDLDILLDIPGLPPIPSYNMPNLMLDRTLKVYQYFMDTAIQMAKSAGLIVNTFEGLEQRALKAILDGQCVPGESMPPIYCIGPVIASSGKDDQHECLTWLDSQPSRSVVFLSFGSMGRFSAKQLKEMAIGLERSGVRFLWVVRTPPPDNGARPMLATEEPSLESFLPEGFLDRTKDRGFVVESWAPQVAVLNHDSVGGFVTHCGWNSILEAVCAGVPMLAWPLFAEQKINRGFLVEEIKVALSVTESRDGFVSADELEIRVPKLIDSEQGKALRERVMKMRGGAVAAISEGGSSRVALANLATTWSLGQGARTLAFV